MPRSAATGGARFVEGGVGVDAIRVRGARVHNLKDVDVDVPRNRLVVVTGPSGSGKSSLAFDTLYAEGQRQYIESLSVYARQFLHQMPRPDVDWIDGLQPTICIDQRPTSSNPRSTVATVTEIYDYLRVLMARLGEVFCHRCGEPIRQQSAEEIQDALMALPEGTKAMLLAPVVRGRRGKQAEALARVRKAGFVRLRVDGRVVDIDQLPDLDPKRRHQVEAVVDRVIVRPGIRARLGESVRLAIRHGEGLVIASHLEANGDQRDGRSGRWQDRLFSTRYACPACDLSFEELEPRTFSFNSPYGACPHCQGLGRLEQFDPDRVLPDPNKSLADGAIAPWNRAGTAAVKKLRAALSDFMREHGFAWDTPIVALKPRMRERLLHGDGHRFLGVLTLLEKEYATTTLERRRDELAGFRDQVPCPACGGSRLRPEANGVRLGGKTIHQICSMPVDEAGRFFERLSFPDAQRPIADPLVSEIAKRLAFLQNVGVAYLTLTRPADTLSGGESQRVRLAGSIGSGLVGVCYVLDEPTIGLHPRDNRRLIGALRDLQRGGNTVLVVEHDESMIREADHVIDVGPGSGSGGGRIVAQGTVDEVACCAQSVTGRYLRGDMSIPVPPRRRRVAKSRSLLIGGVTTHNLKNIDVRFPLGALVCVTGVSGSGKSSLVGQTLAPALVRRFGGVGPKPGPFSRLRGAGKIDRVISIDQSPIGRTPRSTPATYVGVFDEIRKAFARTREAKRRGFGAGRFSFNVKGGRCEHCQGHGVTKMEMSFLPDLYVTCNQCSGARFNRQTLSVRYRGQSIADVLAMSVDEAAGFFENFPGIHRWLRSLRDVGLGYLCLGQSSITLSGGESQRIKLASQLARAETGKTLYVLDEPTTGLHFDDVRRLLAVLGRLVDRGNTVIVIEHNLDVIKCADWIIDLGPEGGAAGGYVLAEGTPEAIAEREDNPTGRYLQSALRPPGRSTENGSPPFDRARPES